MKAWRKVSWLLVLTMIISSISAITISASAETVTTGTTGDCTWTLDGTVLTISGDGEMEDYGDFTDGFLRDSIERPWGTSATEVVVESGVTAIGILAFADCVNLTSVSIPKSVRVIGYEAFSGCYNIKGVYINDLTAWCKIHFMNGDYMENRTSPLARQEAKLYLNNEIVTVLEYPAELESVSDSFSAYKKLERVIIPNGITEIEYGAFAGCSNLTSITIPESVVDVGIGAFDYCSNLTEINVPDGYTVLNRRNMGYIANLTRYDPEYWTEYWESDEVYLGNNLFGVKDTVSGSYGIKDGTVAILDGAFSGCTDLTSVNIPKSVTSIGVQAFYNCGRLTDVYYGGTKEEWKQVFIGAQNEAFLRAEIHYTEPHSHSFTTYVYNNDAITEKDGTKTATCTCGAKDTVTAVGTKIKNPFTDVKAGEYYTDPVLWAVGKGITNGTSATSFSPNAQCTRGQIVTFLWRAAGSPEPQSTRNPFKDVKSDQYYYKAVLWAVEKGVTTGISATEFAPNATCTRGQVVTFLWRAKGKPSATASTSFTDVKAGQYYTEAVAWAVKNGVTTGISPTEFAPNATCTRGQIVTFLYRAYK